MKGLSFNMRFELRKIIDAGAEGLAFSNTNRTADALSTRGMIERIPRTESDRICFRHRWVATEAGKKAVRQ